MVRLIKKKKFKTTFMPQICDTAKKKKKKWLKANTGG